jgi:DNA-binding NtrC family response regulator
MVNRVMAVDDDPGVLFTVQAVLEEAGIDIITANGGKECLEHLRKGFSGVILMDVMMPEMDGWQTIKAIISEGLMSGNIICILSAKHVPDQEFDQLKQYVPEYIKKPFEPDELITIIKHYFTCIVPKEKP